MALHCFTQLANDSLKISIEAFTFCIDIQFYLQFKDERLENIVK